jgi:hypothetical protein
VAQGVVDHPILGPGNKQYFYHHSSSSLEPG